MMTTLSSPSAIPATLTEPAPNVDRTATCPAALARLTAAQRALVREAVTVNLAYVNSDLFKRASVERELFKAASTSWYHPMADDELAARPAPRSSLLTTAQEKQAFLRYNFARMRAQAAVHKFQARPGAQAARGVALWYGRVRDTRDVITRANLALVVAMVRRTRTATADFGELVSEGNMALLRAVEKFDIGRGFKFSTYACRAMLKAFSRIEMKNSRYRRVFALEFDPAMEPSNYLELRRADLERDVVEELRRIIAENRAQLSAIERKVIQTRFAVHGGRNAEAMTLEEVGRVIGVTKERVRQIQNHALGKLRATIDHEVLTPSRTSAAAPHPCARVE